MKVQVKPVQKSLKMSLKKGTIKLKKPKVNTVKGKVKPKTKIKPKLEEMTADDFFSQDINDLLDSDKGDTSSVSSFGEASETKLKSPAKKSKKLQKKKEKIKENKSEKLKNGTKLEKKKEKTTESDDELEDEEYEEIDDEELSNEESNNEGGDSNKEDDSEAEESDLILDHKKQLEGLKDTDPEFYNFLKQNDSNLLNFDESDSDSDNRAKEEKFHVPPEKLEVASDESDFESEEEGVEPAGRKNLITHEMISEWQEKLQRKCDHKVIKEVIQAFHAALLSVSQGNELPSIYRVEGSPIFNSVVRLCVTDLRPALKSYLDHPVTPKKSKNWSRVQSAMKLYIIDLTQLLSLSSSEILSVLLKHTHQMSNFIVCFPVIAAKFQKRVIQIWSTEDSDVVRVLSFLCILRLGNLNHTLLGKALKAMYMTYVRNTKFISPNNLPAINFMRQSLAEMFALDDTLTYQMAFLYIRQLAIHLRNAVTLKKKESYQAVYSWQFISSIHLWAEVIGITSQDSPLRSLLYPLVQITIGVIKLNPSIQYFPLRFHCCRILVNLSSKTGTFIPVLPFLLEILKDFSFTRESKVASMKPMDFTCMLRCSKSEMKETAFKDAIIENVYNIFIEYLVTECHRISFPDTVVPTVMQLRQFIKTCKLPNYAKKMKAILEKILENSKFIENERKKLTIKLDDEKAIEAIEISLKTKGTPFMKYYESWKKIHAKQLVRKVATVEKVEDFNFPIIKRDRKPKDDDKSDKPVELFPSDDDDDGGFNIKGDESDDEVPKKPKKVLKKKKEKKKKKKKGANNKKSGDFGDLMKIDAKDVVEDFEMSDSD